MSSLRDCNFIKHCILSPSVPHSSAGQSVEYTLGCQSPDPVIESWAQVRLEEHRPRIWTPTLFRAQGVLWSTCSSVCVSIWFFLEKLSFTNDIDNCDNDYGKFNLQRRTQVKKTGFPNQNLSRWPLTVRKWFWDLIGNKLIIPKQTYNSFCRHYNWWTFWCI